MTSRERVLAALRGETVDRPPLSFWGHVYHRESSAAALVDHTLERWRRFEWDWVKLNPRKHYHVEPWGVRYDYPLPRTGELLLFGPACAGVPGPPSLENRQILTMCLGPVDLQNAVQLLGI